LHLPKHHAIATWTTPDGRQPPFIAQTIPLRVDLERLRLHATRQVERGARHRSDLRQPHWDRSAGTHGDRSAGTHGDRSAAAHRDRSAGISRPAPGREPRQASRVSTRASAGDCPAARLPATPAESYRELVELDRARSVRWAKPVESLAPV